MINIGDNVKLKKDLVTRIEQSKKYNKWYNFVLENKNTVFEVIGYNSNGDLEVKGYDMWLLELEVERV